MRFKNSEVLIGFIMTIIGLFIFLFHVRIGSFYEGFFSFGGSFGFHTGSSTCAVLVVLIALSAFIMVVKPCALTRIVLITLFILFVVSIVLSLKFSIVPMNAATLFLIIGCIVVGLAIWVKGLFSK